MKRETGIHLLTFAVLVTGVACSRDAGTGATAAPAPAAAPATATPSAAPAAAAAKPFDRTFELQGVQFHVTTATVDGTRMVRIEPSGLEIDNDPVEREIDGHLVDGDIGDLDVDGSPEIYLFVKSDDEAARGSLVAYAANQRKSLSEIYLPPMDQTEGATEGYQGHDEFAVVENVIARRFPIVAGTGADAKPEAKTRQLQYKLARGEAGFVLRVDRVVEY
ncbi:MAG: hypothetical protein AB7G12_09430 [Thermoanaerobaculia bacterium]